jgi:hypothetical protein
MRMRRNGDVDRSRRRTHELEADPPGRALHHGHAAGGGGRGGEGPRGHRQPRHRCSPSPHRRIRPRPPLLPSRSVVDHGTSSLAIQQRIEEVVAFVLRSNGGARARVGDSHGTAAGHVSLSLSLSAERTRRNASLVRPKGWLGLCVQTGSIICSEPSEAQSFVAPSIIPRSAKTHLQTRNWPGNPYRERKLGFTLHQISMLRLLRSEDETAIFICIHQHEKSSKKTWVPVPFVASTPFPRI